MRRKLVTCPLCERRVGLDPLGAKDAKGLGVVMEFHLGAGFVGLRTQCLGSFRSIEDLKAEA